MNKTWFIDIDGTIAIHRENYFLDEQLEKENLTVIDTILPGVEQFWSKIPKEDYIIITSARYERHRKITELF